MHRGLDDETVERLLRGDRVDDPTARLLARVLRAAAGPATSDDLRGAERIFAAHSAATRQPNGGRTVRFGPRLARSVSLKLVATVAVATAAGGVALAASTGVLPTPLHPGPDRTHSNATPKPTASGATGSSRPSPVPSASAATDAAVAALCEAYQATDPSQRQRALATPEFAPLVMAAGTAEKVPAFCATTTTAAHSSPEPHVSPSPHPTGRPTARPSHPATGRSTPPSPTRQQH